MTALRSDRMTALRSDHPVARENPMIAILYGLLTIAPGLVTDEDEPSLRELRTAYTRAEDVDERRELLQTLTARAVEDGKVTPEAMAIVALGLADESFELRREAVRLLILGGDREVAVKSLGEALEAVKADAGSLRDAFRGFEGLGRGGAFGGGGGGEQGGAGADEKGGEGGGDEDDPLAGLAAAADQFRGRIDERVAFVEDVIGSLGTLPDDRSVKSLEKFLGRAEGPVLGRYRLPAARALAELGSRSALEAVRDALQRETEKATEESENDERGGRQGRGRGQGGLADLFSDLQNLAGEATENVGPQLHEVLVTAARARELEEFPDWDSRKAARDWKKWLQRHRKEFPAKLGRIARRESDEDE